MQAGNRVEVASPGEGAMELAQRVEEALAQDVAWEPCEAVVAGNAWAKVAVLDEGQHSTG